MERIKLSNSSKKVLRIIADGITSRPAAMDTVEWDRGALALQCVGLAVCHREEGGSVEVCRITELGTLYLATFPSLRDPFDWRWAVTTAIATIGAAAAFSALFIACR